MPSLPTIPIPTSASKIIPTSLPPSPTAAILLPPVYFLISQHMIAFCVGLHLHTHTHGAFIASSKNFYSILFLPLSIVSSVFPSIISTVMAILGEISLIDCSTLTSSSISRINQRWCRRCFKPALIAMEVAVSTLSPVNIHTWIPADFKDSMVNCTLFWSLSSTPVTPKNSRSVSRS